MRSAGLCFALIAIILTAADKATKTTEVPASDIRARVVILGDLGQPIGETVTIHGTTVRPGKGDEVDIAVDSVNGKPLRPRTTVQIKGIAHWPIGAEVEIRGQEVGTVTFTNINHGGWARNDPRFVLRQVLYLSFRGHEVISPRNLKFEFRAP